jgi:diguanylate cyclase (GGDEF)-like protein/PAS domain S-box-containing protein
MARDSRELTTVDLSSRSALDAAIAWPVPAAWLAVAPSPLAILQAMSEAVIATDTSGAITFLNPAAERITGRSAHDLAGVPLARVVDLDGAARTHGACRIHCRDGAVRPAEATMVPLLDEGGRTIGQVVVCRDVGPVLALSQVLSHHAEHDPLTGLSNRRALLLRLEAAVTDALRDGHTTAVAFLDIDGMKQVNDTHGHAAGDELLVSVAGRLRASVRGADTVARLGGDEFVVLLARVESPGDADALMRALRRALAAPHRLTSGEVRVGASVGLAWCPDHGGTPADLLSRADRAMYRAKQDRSGVALAER